MKVSKKRLFCLSLALIFVLGALPALAVPEGIATPVAFLPDPGEITYTGRNIVMFIINTPAENFLRLVDAKGTMPHSAYTVEMTDDNKTRITLHASYLNALATGTYSISAVFSTGAGAITLNVPFGAQTADTGTKDASYFEPSSGKVTRKVNLMSAADYKVLGSIPKNAKVTVLGFLGDDAVVRYKDLEGTVPGDAVRVDFKSPANAELAEPAVGYSVMRESERNAIIRFHREGAPLTISGRYGEWLRATYTKGGKSYRFYIKAEHVRLNITWTIAIDEEELPFDGASTAALPDDDEVVPSL